MKLAIHQSLLPSLTLLLCPQDPSSMPYVTIGRLSIQEEKHVKRKGAIQVKLYFWR